MSASLPAQPVVRSEPALHPSVERAALIYARGDAVSAIGVLGEALAETGPGAPPRAAWLVLFDLHQLSGDRRAFESLAIDYVTRFESSPPAWVEPERDESGQRLSPAAEPIQVERLPARVDGEDALRLWQVLAQTSAERPILIDCTQVTALDEAGAAGLLAVLRDARSGADDCPVTVDGVENLLDAAQRSIADCTPGESEGGWMLAFLALRLLGRQSVFEDLAVRYCVALEVSPPSWEPPPSSVRLARPMDNSAVTNQRVPGPSPRGAPARRGAPGITLPLAGDADARTASDLRAIAELVPVRGTELSIDCRRLRRLDEPALAELRARVAQLHASGVKVNLLEPNRVVQALMQKAGLHRIARLRERRI